MGRGAAGSEGTGSVEGGREAEQYREQRQGTLGQQGCLLWELTPQLEVPPSHGRA